jgi:hypothetical protein
VVSEPLLLSKLHRTRATHGWDRSLCVTRLTAALREDDIVRELVLMRLLLLLVLMRLPLRRCWWTVLLFAPQRCTVLLFAPLWRQCVHRYSNSTKSLECGVQTPTDGGSGAGAPTPAITCSPAR